MTAGAVAGVDIRTDAGLLGHSEGHPECTVHPEIGWQARESGSGRPGRHWKVALRRGLGPCGGREDRLLARQPCACQDLIRQDAPLIAARDTRNPDAATAG